jgi:hypothetical protein
MKYRILQAVQIRLICHVVSFGVNVGKADFDKVKSMEKGIKYALESRQ